MTSHELAKKLLEGPDLPVQVSVDNPKDLAYSKDVSVKTSRNLVHISGWVASDYNEEYAYAPWVRQ